MQTINTRFEPGPETIITQDNLQRPVVNAQSLAGLDLLQQLHRQPERRIWFCGAYAAEGVPF